MKKLLLFGLMCVCALRLWADEPAGVKRIQDVVYGRKFGTALTMDVLTPTNSNGIGIILVMSGGWFSSHEMIQPALYKALFARGYVIFAVVHGSQPKYTIPEITQDMTRAVRFIRHHAAEYGVDPNRLGVSGGSAGGHLSLTLGTHGANGTNGAPDAVDHESSAVQCVACFFPPTDFLNYGAPGVDAVGTGILKDFKPAFGPMSDTEEGRQKLGKEISPIYFVTSNTPPTLIIHGSADPLVPIQQSETYVKRCHEEGVPAELVVKEGKSHGWPNWNADLAICADWFDKYLRGIKK